MRWDERKNVAGKHLFAGGFLGDTGQGLGASHQTGWTALVTRLLEDCCLSRKIFPADSKDSRLGSEYGLGQAVTAGPARTS